VPEGVGNGDAGIASALTMVANGPSIALDMPGNFVAPLPTERRDDGAPRYPAPSALSSAVKLADELRGAVALAIEGLDFDDDLASAIAADA
jgi:hypothetical protein